MKENNVLKMFGSGTITSASQYSMSTPQERFSRQLDRDRRRNRLSQSSLRTLITNDTAQWARAILSEKLATNNAVNYTNTQNQSKQRIATISESGGTVSGDIRVSSGIAPTASTTSSSSMAPLISAKDMGDLLYWDGLKWAILKRPEANTLRVLTIQGGILNWMATEDC